MRYLSSIFGFSFLVCLLVSCKPKVPSGVLSESKMTKVLYDYHLAQCAAEEVHGDVDKSRYLYIQSVFSKHGITEAEFDSSMVWYSAHSGKLQKIYENLILRLESESKGLGVGVSESEVYASMSDVGDTANIWTGNRFIVLKNDKMHNLSVITMQSDSTFRPGDNFKISFSTNFITLGSRDGFASLVVYFKDGSNKVSHMRLNSDRDCVLTLPNDINNDNRETDHIIIQFYKAPDSRLDDKASYMIIRNPALIRMHKPKDEKVFGVTPLNENIDSLDVGARDDSLVIIDTSNIVTPENKTDIHVDRKQVDIQRERPVVPRRPVMRRPNRKR